MANRFLRTSVTESELGRIHNLLDDVIEGRSLRDVRELFANPCRARVALLVRVVLHVEDERRALDVAALHQCLRAAVEIDVVGTRGEELLQRGSVTLSRGIDEGSEEVRRLRWEVPAGLVRDVYRELVP